MDDLKEAVEKTAKFKYSEHLNEGSKSQVFCQFEEDFFCYMHISQG